VTPGEVALLDAVNMLPTRQVTIGLAVRLSGGRFRHFADVMLPATSKHHGISDRCVCDAGNGKPDARGTLWERFRNAACGRWPHDVSRFVLILACREV
jgi:hypothetical protein